MDRSQARTADDVIRLRSTRARFMALAGLDNANALRVWREDQSAKTGLLLKPDASAVIRDSIWSDTVKLSPARRLWTSLRMSSAGKQHEEFEVVKAGKVAIESGEYAADHGAGRHTPHGRALAQLRLMTELSNDPHLSGVSYALMGRSRALFPKLAPLWPAAVAKGDSMNFHQVLNALGKGSFDRRQTSDPRTHDRSLLTLDSDQWTAVVEYAHELIADVPDWIGVKIDQLEKEFDLSDKQESTIGPARLLDEVTRKRGVGERYLDL